MSFPEPTLTALLGQAVGDAFGAPFEYEAQGAAMARLSLQEQRYLDACSDVGMPSRRARLSGLYTDDTQQALALLHAWRTVDEPLDPEAVGARFREIVEGMYRAFVPGTRSGVHRGTGKNFRESVRRGGPIETAGLGAAMRVGPVATLLPDLETLLPWVVLVCRETTTHPIALTGAALFAACCHAEVRGTADGLTDRLLSWLDTSSAAALGLPREAWLDLLRARVVMDAAGEDELLEFASESGYANKVLDCAANGFALTGIPWVLFHARSASFPGALEKVCASGGDTDTVAAMVGCLTALRLGARAIPQWMVDGLIGRSSVLEPDSWDPIRTERLLTQREEEHRREVRVRRSRAFWTDIGLETGTPPPEPDPLDALPDDALLEELVEPTEEIPRGEIPRSDAPQPAELSGVPMNLPMSVSSVSKTPAAPAPPTPSGEQLDLFGKPR